jgi:hypothetical protein
MNLPSTIMTASAIRPLTSSVCSGKNEIDPAPRRPAGIEMMKKRMVVI